MLLAERKRLKSFSKTNELTLIEYIKTSIDILMNMKSMDIISDSNQAYEDA